MRILIITPVFPLPLDTGTRVRLYNLAREFKALGHCIGLLSFADGSSLPHLKEMQKICEHIEIISIGDARQGKRTFKEIVHRLFLVAGAIIKGMPPRFAQVKHPGMMSKASRLVPEYDLVFIEFFFMAQNIHKTLIQRFAEKFVLVEHDISFIPARRQWKHASGLLRMIAWVSYQGIKYSEMRVLRRFRTVAAMSIADQNYLAGRLSQTRVLLFPNGVDTETIQPQKERRNPNTLRTDLLYIGGLAHFPNYDAVAFFLQSMLPEIQTHFSNVRLVVIGNTAGRSQKLERMASGSVVFTGFVPHIEDYYANCLAVVVPLRIAGGTRLKVLEAMAAGVPVVSTAVGVEGLDVEAELHYLKAEDAAEMAAAIGQIRNDTNVVDTLIAAAREVCEQKYAWKIIAKNILTEIQ
ncbi:MAG: hypothetical protein CSA22_09465 [Deltaproteobacteria bacterium]|nr:MAG: hypothetical protein CSA22_09465 [Deltaproteobacteria bacterium]